MKRKGYREVKDVKIFVALGVLLVLAVGVLFVSASLTGRVTGGDCAKIKGECKLSCGADEVEVDVSGCGSVGTLGTLTFGLFGDSEVCCYSEGAAAIDVDLETGRVLYLPFDADVSSVEGGAVKDASEMGNDATLGEGVSDSAPTWTANGKIGGAYVFDGVDDYVSVSDDDSLDLVDDLTIALWFKPDLLSMGAMSLLLSKRDASDYFVPYQLSFYGLQEPQKCADRPCVRGASGGGSAATYGEVMSSKVESMDWHHVVYVIELGTARMYLDGAREMAEESLSGTGSKNSMPILIGVYPKNGMPHSYYFKGIIDEIMIYNKALGDDEVTALYEMECRSDAHCEGALVCEAGMCVDKSGGGGAGSVAFSVAAIEDQVVKVNKTLRLQVKIKNATQGVNYVFYDNSTLFDINNKTGLINYLPVKDDVGKYVVRVKASNGTLNKSAVFGLSVVKADNVSIGGDGNDTNGNMTGNDTDGNMTGNDTDGNLIIDNWGQYDTCESMGYACVAEAACDGLRKIAYDVDCYGGEVCCDASVGFGDGGDDDGGDSEGEEGGGLGWLWITLGAVLLLGGGGFALWQFYLKPKGIFGFGGGGGEPIGLAKPAKPAKPAGGNLSAEDELKKLAGE